MFLKMKKKWGWWQKAKLLSEAEMVIGLTMPIGYSTQQVWESGTNYLFQVEITSYQKKLSLQPLQALFRQKATSPKDATVSTRNTSRGNALGLPGTPDRVHCSCFCVLTQRTTNPNWIRSRVSSKVPLHQSCLWVPILKRYYCSSSDVYVSEYSGNCYSNILNPPELT